MKELDNVVAHFSGDSGDGMQSGNISPLFRQQGNGVSTFPTIRQRPVPRKGPLTGEGVVPVHWEQVRFIPCGDCCDALVAMECCCEDAV